MGRRIGEGRVEERVGGRIVNTKDVWKSHMEAYCFTSFQCAHIKGFNWSESIKGKTPLPDATIAK